MALDFTRFYNIINGKAVGTFTTRHSVNPTTLEPNPEVPQSRPSDVDEAISAAKAAFTTWSQVSWKERRKAMQLFSEAIHSLKEEFAQLLVKELGKPLDSAREEVGIVVAFTKYFTQVELEDEVVQEKETLRIVTKHTPLGVTVGIVPWNMPFALSATKFGPALMTGNVVILKPSPFTPYSALKLVELAQGFFPPGVLQVLSGDDNLGPWLTSHPDVDRVSFTGSSSTGKLVMQSCGTTLKRLSLELGGNDPAIVYPDVNIKDVVPKIAQHAFFNSGQICLAIKRLYVHINIYDKFLSELIAYVQNLLPVGQDAKEPAYFHPVQNAPHFERVKNLLAYIEEQKYKLALGDPKTAVVGKGYYVSPLILDNPSDESRIVTEEQFAPILPVLKWTDEEDVLRRANNTAMGLGSSVWTNDVAAAERATAKLQSGIVWTNTHFEAYPFVGFSPMKHSGMGTELGVEGFKDCCNRQAHISRKLVADSH